MNQFAGYAHRVPLGWWAMLRLARDARPQPLMSKGAKPSVFQTEGEAWKAVAQHAFAYMNGTEIRGERFDGHSTYRDEVDRVFFQPRPADGERKAVGA